MKSDNITADDVNTFYDKSKEDAENAGYHLNPDEAFTKELLESILKPVALCLWGCPVAGPESKKRP